MDSTAEQAQKSTLSSDSHTVLTLHFTSSGPPLGDCVTALLGDHLRQLSAAAPPEGDDR